MNTERERFIRDPNSREAKLIADWDKAKGTLKTDEGIPQLYISGWIDGHESQSATIADLQQQLTEANRWLSAYKVWHDELQKQVDEANRLYSDLIMQVGIKHPDESRHETARRYILNAENQSNLPLATATSKRGG